MSAGILEPNGAMGRWETGDIVQFKDGRRAIVVAVGKITYQLKVLGGGGTLLLTPAELADLED